MGCVHYIRSQLLISNTSLCTNKWYRYFNLLNQNSDVIITSNKLNLSKTGATKRVLFHIYNQNQELDLISNYFSSSPLRADLPTRTMNQLVQYFLNSTRQARANPARSRAGCDTQPGMRSPHTMLYHCNGN